MRHGGNSGLTTIAYTTAGQLAEAFDEWTEGHKAYQEPHAQVVGAAEMAAALGSGDSGCGLETGVFKITWWGSEAAVAAALSALLVTLGEDAEVIRSLANCVEVLPQAGLWEGTRSASCTGLAWGGDLQRLGLGGRRERQRHVINGEGGRRRQCGYGERRCRGGGSGCA